jgi:hypothetical protein
MFEQIVRPFQSRQVITTRRIVPSVSDGSDTGTAVLTWGEAGKIERGAPQEDGLDYGTAGFNVECCNDTWDQSGQPETEDVEIRSGVTVRRVRQIAFKNEHKNGCFEDITSWSYVASGVAESVAGLESDIRGLRNCKATYKLNFD